ncbi:50S ribosomal protein L11 [Candidatus Pinguicoccus supinus]|uniref:Large ribosomal subunit protein uL11 n=1 Tax=Candidatus Pinguicoccus supinus TaxID=2529394 RepID=A0A7T0BRG7_9BACT|nr:50S ribosomal protein L11 [Candidatus Pinguicoccus supinus]
MKKLIARIKLKLKAESANPAPPVGSSLGVFGINIMDFCKKYNFKTRGLKGIIPVHIKVFSDKSFIFSIKLNPISELVKTVDIINKNLIGEGVESKCLRVEDLNKIAFLKIKDLNTNSLKTASKII